MPARSRRPSRRGLGCAGVLGVLVALGLAAVGLGWLTLGLLPELQTRRPAASPNLPALAAAFLPYGLVAWLMVLILTVPALVRARRRFVPGALTLLAVVGLLIQGSWVAPYFVGRVPSVAQPMEIVSLNLLQGQADVEEVLDATRSADLVVFAELRPEIRDRLRQAGFEKRFGYSVTEKGGYVTDTGIYSRWPISAARTIDLSTQQWVATVRTPDHGNVVVAAVHPLNPTHGSNVWAAEGDRLFRELREYSDRPTIIAGDFNMIHRHLPLSRFLDNGFRDASEQANAGWSPSWPTTLPPPGGRPGLIAIDHVLVSEDLAASTFATFPVSGTDHRGLRVHLG